MTGVVDRGDGCRVHWRYVPASLRTSRLARCSAWIIKIDGLDFGSDLWRVDALMTRQTRLLVNEFLSKPPRKLENRFERDR